MSVASFGFRRNDWTRRLLTTAPLGSRDGRPVSSPETPSRCSRVALAASLSPRYDLPDLTINFWHSVFVRAVKKDGATSRVFWRTYVHNGAESRSRRSPCRLGLSWKSRACCAHSLPKSLHENDTSIQKCSAWKPLLRSYPISLRDWGRSATRPISVASELIRTCKIPS